MLRATTSASKCFLFFLEISFEEFDMSIPYTAYSVNRYAWLVLGEKICVNNNY